MPIRIFLRHFSLNISFALSLFSKYLKKRHKLVTPGCERGGGREGGMREREEEEREGRMGEREGEKEEREEGKAATCMHHAVLLVSSTPCCSLSMLSSPTDRG